MQNQGNEASTIPLEKPQLTVAPGQSPSALYSIKSSPSKGLGVFANQDIAKGTRITWEKPLLSAPREPEAIDPLPVYDAFEELTHDQKKQYLSLSASQIQTENALQCIEDDLPRDFRDHVANVASIFESNAFDMVEVEDGTTLAGVFPIAARFNHDCAPNVAQTWNESIEALTMHAIRDVKAGEELCDTYVPLCQPSTSRQAELRAYGFECKCSVCGGDAKSLKKSDAQRRMMYRLGNDLTFLAEREKGGKLGPFPTSVLRQGQVDALNVVSYLEHLLKDEGLATHDLIRW